LDSKRRHVTSGTKEWADHNVNCISGCSNDCRYCYAKMIGTRFGRCTESTWKNMEIRKKDVERNYKKYKGRVMFPSSHDIVDEPGVKNACYTVLEKLLKAGNEVLITTKPLLNVTKEIITKFSFYKDQIQFRFTITSKNDETIAFWEPNAPSYDERKKSLSLAYEEGFKTSVSVEPFLDENPQELIKEIKPCVTESIWIGPMNYIRRNDIPTEDVIFYDRIRTYIDDDNLFKIYSDLKNKSKIKFKDSMKIKLNLL
jgi:DNA repair photolyase